MRISALLVVVAVALGASACGIYPYGAVYNGTTIPHAMMRVNGDGTNKGGSKRGEACATGILWLIAWGDASTSAAKGAGNIKEVHSVEFEDTLVLGGLYNKGCTVVYGE